MEGMGVRFCGYGAGLLTATVGGVGMGRGCILVLGTLRFLVSLNSGTSCMFKGKQLWMSPSMAAVLATSIRVGVDEERLEFGGRRWSTYE